MGVVHYDINPRNMLFSIQTTRSIVIDFRKACVREGEMD
jgi:Ser/Thr protein kinase RdoA (MazF antagonist)